MQGRRLTAAELVASKRKWLESFAEHGIYHAACRDANVHYATVRRWEEHDEDFSLAKQVALAQSNDRIREEITRRAITGVDKPIYYKGVEVDTVKEYSDILLIFHAKARMPEYRDKTQIEHSGTLTVADVVRLASEEVSVATERSST